MTDPKFLPVFSGWLRVMGEDVLSLANLLEAPTAPAAHRRAAAEALQSLSRLAEIIPAGIEPLGYLEGAFGFRVLAERALTEPVVTEREGFDEPGFDEQAFGEQGLGEQPVADAVGDQASGEELFSDEGLGEPVRGGQVPAEDARHEHASSEEAFRGQEPAEALDPTEEGIADGRVPRLAAEAALVAEFLGDDMPRFREKWLAPEATTRAGRAASEVLYDDELRREVQRESRQWVEHFQAPELDEGAEELVKVEAFFRKRLRRGE